MSRREREPGPGAGRTNHSGGRTTQTTWTTWAGGGCTSHSPALVMGFILEEGVQHCSKESSATAPPSVSELLSCAGRVANGRTQCANALPFTSAHSPETAT